MINMVRVVILGVGNILRRDDGLGSLIAQKLKKMAARRASHRPLWGHGNIPVFDGGEAPENYLEKILGHNPETVLIVDTVDFNGTPGEIRIFDKDALLHGDFSTHGISLKLAMEYLKNRGVKEVKLIGVQPKYTGLGEGLSKEVNESLDKVISLCMNYR